MQRPGWRVASHDRSVGGEVRDVAGNHLFAQGLHFDVEAAQRAGVDSIALRCGGYWSVRTCKGHSLFWMIPPLCWPSGPLRRLAQTVLGTLRRSIRRSRRVAVPTVRGAVREDRVLRVGDAADVVADVFVAHGSLRAHLRSMVESGRSHRYTRDSVAPSTISRSPSASRRRPLLL